MKTKQKQVWYVVKKWDVCPILNVVIKQDNVSIIQFFRNKFLDLSRDAKREFIGNRITNKNTNTGSSTTEFFLENIDTIKYYTSQGMIPLKPSCTTTYGKSMSFIFCVGFTSE